MVIGWVVFVVISLRLITIEINEVELLIDWKKKEELQAYLYTLSAKLWQAKNRTIEERRIKWKVRRSSRKG